MINLTQHAATPEQIAAGVVEPADKLSVQNIMTFGEAPTHMEMRERAKALADIARASGAKAAMIGGAPYFMAPLEEALCLFGIEVFYSFTRREAVEEEQADGGVRKTQIFRHVSFVPGTVRTVAVRRDDPRLQMETVDLSLDVRARKALVKDGLTTVGTIIRRTELELLRVPNFGRKSLYILQDRLAEDGLKLGMTVL